MILPATISGVIDAHARREPGRPALLCPGVKTLSFDGLSRVLRRMREELRAAGIGPTSRVGVVLPRGPEAAMVGVAVSAAATYVPINATLAPGELQSEVAQLRVHALVLPGWVEVPGWAAGNTVRIFRVSRIRASFEDFELKTDDLKTDMRGEPWSAEASDVGAKSFCAIFRTSGTTGKSKRVPVTHETLIAMVQRTRRWLTPDDRSACILALHYSAGYKVALMVPLLMGCSVAVPASSNPQEFDQWLSELRPTWLVAAPTVLLSALDRLRTLPPGKPEHSLRFVLSTGAYLPDPLREEFQARIGVNVSEVYGLSESGLVTGPPSPPIATRPGTVGVIVPGEVAIRGADDTFLPSGKVGQVVIRGPNVTPGYLYDIDDMPSKPADGWLVTGDLGSLDADGFLTIGGRTKEIINRGGEKISPYDVEKVLLQHPEVREAAVFGVPHPRLGEQVASAVVLASDATVMDADLLDFLYDRLAPFQMPRHVHVITEMPLGPTGKISRSQLAARFASYAPPTVLPDSPLQIQIAEIWERLFNRTDIGIDDDFFDIGGDSLQATEMMLELEAATRQAIPPSEIKAKVTIRNLATALARTAEQSEELVTRIKDGDGVPLFFCHGDVDGRGFYALKLAELLKGEGPVYVLHPNLDKARGIASIEAMVDRYLPAIQAAHPEGEVRVGGYCCGGIVAWEVAHRLEKAGRKVEQLVLIDSFSLNARAGLRSVFSVVKMFGAIVPGRLGERVRHDVMPLAWGVARRILQRDRAIFQRIVDRLHDQPQVSESQRTKYYRAMANYLPAKVQSRVLCLLCEEYQHDKNVSPVAWRALAPLVDQELIPGGHNTCITSHVRELAETLDRRLSLMPG